jgi:hypothetical protein
MSLFQDSSSSSAPQPPGTLAPRSRAAFHATIKPPQLHAPNTTLLQSRCATWRSIVSSWTIPSSPQTVTRTIRPFACQSNYLIALSRYERERIHSWLQQHDVSPLTNTVLGRKILTTNLLARVLSNAWREQHGLPIPPTPVFDKGEKCVRGAVLSAAGSSATHLFSHLSREAISRSNLKCWTMLLRI